MAPRKRPSLDDQLNQKPAPPVEPAKVSTSVSVDTPTSTKAKARVGKKAVAGFFDVTTARQLKVLGAQQDRTTQSMLGEALNMLFERYGLPPSADESSNG